MILYHKQQEEEERYLQILSSFVQQVVGYIYELTRFIGEPATVWPSSS